MAKLRAVFRDYSFTDKIIKEGEQYEEASKMLDIQPHIWYFYYWRDKDLEGNQFYTYPIEIEDIEYYKKNKTL